MKAYRRSGAGYALAKHVLSNHHGAWEVGEMPANLTAQVFWLGQMLGRLEATVHDLIAA